MSKELLPDLPIARGATPLLTDGTITPACPYQGLVERYGRRALERYRYMAAATAEIDVTPVAGDSFESWDDLALTAHQIAYRQIEPRTMALGGDLPAADKRHADERLRIDSRAGAAQIAAFLQVIPRVLFRTEFAEPDVELADRAQRSKALMVRWSKLDETADARLAYGTAYPKPDLRSGDPYDGLRFHPKWFEEKPNGAVGFRPEKLPHIRDERGRGLLLGERDTAILGCPAVNLVPALYDVMVEAAAANGLFSTTYRTERRHHAYDE